MTEIRNSQGKLVCRADKDNKTVEIAVKGNVTVIRFTDDGKMKIENTERKVEKTKYPQTARRQGKQISIAFTPSFLFAENSTALRIPPNSRS